MWQPLHPRIAPFPLLKDAEHASDIQHHLINIYIEYTNTLNPQQVAAVDCSSQSIYVLSKIVEISGKCIFEVLCFVISH